MIYVLPHRIVVLLMIASLMSACGIREQVPSAGATPLSGQTGITPSVTPRDKFDYATQQARAIATERVIDWPTVPAITFAPATAIPQPTGFLDDCFYTMLRGFTPRNCWREQLPNGEYIQIYAGYGKNRDDGLLYVMGHDPTGIVADGTPADYILSGTLGSFKVLSVNYPIVNLDVRGRTFQFALDTRQWVTASGTPIPVTPTATKIAR